MTLTTTAHLTFRGDARRALDFYRSVFGGHTTAVTYADAGAASGAAEADWLMWGEVVTDDGFHVMAYDVPSHLPWERGENSFLVSVRGADVAEVGDRWQRLAAGASVLRPLEPAPWATAYGMLRDRFGVTWVLDVVGG
ncbi:VOC family protein [Streptomyces sp. NPDC057702]|uniref:VOC family protein n=1 Tax=unclassified Streptomyces TaxID=2593676 RepID=UPI0036D11AF6